MYVKKSLMLWAAVFALALPLLIAGSAGAKYMSDGAVQDPAGGFITPNDMVCVIGVHADGTLDIAPGVTSRRDCIYYTTGLTGLAPVDVTSAVTPSTLCTGVSTTTKGSLTWVAGSENKCYDSAPCTVADFTAGTYYGSIDFPSNDGAKHAIATSICVDGSGNGISLTGLDRTAQMCAAKGGTWKQTSATAPAGFAGTFPTPGFGGACIAYGAQFKGQDAAGTPKAFSAKGTDSSVVTDMGFCYASMNWTAVYPTASCPSLKATTAPFDANAAYDWSVASSQCRYAKSIAGKLSSAITKADGSTVAAGTYVDLSTYTTMGDCIANGGSWNNWVGKAATTSVVGSDSNTYTKPNWDYKTQAPDADEGCLHCHSTKTEYNGPAERFKESYLKTGHKNMLRKVTAGNAYTGPDGVAYSAYAAGTLNFATPSAQVSGVDKPLLYLFGDWMAAAPAGLDVIVDMGTPTGAKYNGGSNYSCAACHTTGWSNNDGAAGVCTVSSKTTASACATAGGTWYPMIGNNAIGDSTYVPQEPATSFPGITFTGAGKWDIEGITCGRCHNAAVGPINATMIAASPYKTTMPQGGGMGNIPGGPTGTWATNLCFGCHQSMAKTSNGTGLDADLTTPTALIVKNTAVAPAYVPGFSGHVIGNSFLNSPHSRFTGTVMPNALGKYDLVLPGATNSTFKGYMCWQSPSSSSPAKTKADGTEIKDKATCETLYGAGAWRPDTQGNCTTCHDVHNSLFVVGQEGLRKECVSCHNNSTYASDVPGTAQASSISHPTGAGTPEGVDPADPCVVCHMPKPTGGDFPMHVWRINSDPNYSTFPSAASYGAGTTPVRKNANTAADGSYTNAVWVDLDLSCGECHGTSGTAHLISKAGLASYAAAMHSGGGAPTTNCATCHATSQNGTTAIKGGFGPGKNHHGGVPGETAECTGCHTRPGTLPSNWQTTAFCRTCHSAAPGPYQLLDPQHPRTATTPNSCSACHFAGGFMPSPATDRTCDQCHGGGSNPAGPYTGTLIATAPWLSSAALGNMGLSIHTALASQTTATPLVSHGTVAINGWTVTFSETSSDPDNTVDVVTVNWGDGVIEKKDTTPGTTFSHDYSRLWTRPSPTGPFVDAGANPNPRPRIFTITHSVTDKVKPTLIVKESIKVNVPQRFTVSGVVRAADGTTPMLGATISLKLNGHTVKYAKGSSFSFTNVLPGGPYTIRVYKYRNTFSDVTIPTLSTDVSATILAN